MPPMIAEAEGVASGSPTAAPHQVGQEQLDVRSPSWRGIGDERGLAEHHKANLGKRVGLFTRGKNSS